ncbi:MAG: GntR family transcriptional regulator [Rhodospirillaceae bacterium]|nr:GntR family transcriptional regulator [Rhodospirillaceae bacterium]
MATGPTKAKRRATTLRKKPRIASTKMAALGDVPHGTTHEDIYARLKRAIMSAHYIPGERLVVSKLEKLFGTSAMPVREALRRLVAEQALQNNPNRGVEVPQMTAGRLMDLRRVRCEIEGKATEWAALTITKPELARLADIQAEMNRAAGAGSAEGYLDLNLDFHFAIYKAARSPLLLPIIESLWMQVGPCLNTMRGEATLGLGMDHHEAMIAALRKGDGAGARVALQEDISEAADIILRLLPESAN